MAYTQLVVVDVTDSEILVLCKGGQVSVGTEDRLTYIRRYFLEEAILTGSILIVFLYLRNTLECFTLPSAVLDFSLYAVLLISFCSTM